MIAGAAVIREVADATAKRIREELRETAAGMTPKEMAETKVAAAKLSAKYPSISQTDAMHTIRNARGMTGSMEEGMEVAEELAKTRVILQVQHPGKDVTEDLDLLMKAIEMRGDAKDPARLKRTMNNINKGLNAFGDTYSPTQYYEAIQIGRQVSSALSERFVAQTLPTLSQEMKGASFGQSVSTLNNAIIGNHMPHSAIKEFARLGLIDEKDLDYLKSGEVKGIKRGGHIKGWKTAMSDPDIWVNEFLSKALERKGYKSDEEKRGEMGILFPNRTEGQLVGILLAQQARLAKEAKLWGQAKGSEAADAFARSDPGVAWAGLKTAAEGLGVTFGESLGKSIAPALSDLSKSIADANLRMATGERYREEHPNETPPAQRRFNRFINGLLGADGDAGRDPEKFALA
jgi:hypothetical protein